MRYTNRVHTRENSEIEREEKIKYHRTRFIICLALWLGLGVYRLIKWLNV